MKGSEADRGKLERTVATMKVEGLTMAEKDEGGERMAEMEGGRKWGREAEGEDGSFGNGHRVSVVQYECARKDNKHPTCLIIVSLGLTMTWNYAGSVGKMDMSKGKK